VNVPELEDTVYGAILFGMLEQQWAELPADDDGDELAFRCIRAAYGRGYVDALEQPRP
jgi:hypothetical protein